MKRSRRAILLLVAAAATGTLAMVLVSGYSSSVIDTYGELRPVLVLTRDLPGRRVLSAKAAGRNLEVRQVPGRFVPARALTSPADAVGLQPLAALPAGSYLTANLLRLPGSDRPRIRPPGRGRSAVEIAVSGAGALAGAGGRVDVLVTSEPSTGGRGRTTIAASRVPLIAVGRPGAADAGPGLTRVTLGLTRREAIRLIQAESFARRLTVLPRGGRR